jgi:hypothetical protein
VRKEVSEPGKHIAQIAALIKHHDSHHLTQSCAGHNVSRTSGARCMKEQRAAEQPLGVCRATRQPFQKLSQVTPNRISYPVEGRRPKAELGRRFSFDRDTEAPVE